MAEGYMIAPGQTAQELDYKRRLAYALMKEGADASPIQHWTQGLARLGQGALGGYEMYAAEKADKDETARGNELMAKFLMQGQGGQPSAAPPAAPANPAMTPPMGQNVGAALAAGPTQQPSPMSRPEVMPSAKVWGDKEAEAAGLYEPSAKPVQMAQASPQAALPTPTPMPAQTANGGTVAPGTTLQPGLNREALIAMLGNRKTNPMAQQLISAQMQQQFAPKGTDEIKEFEYAQKNPAFKDYKTDLKRAGAIQNQVVIDQKGELEFSKEAGKQQAKRFDDLAAEAPKAKQMVSDVQTLTELGNQIGTGKTAEAKAVIGPYAQALGIDVKGLNEIQAYEAIVNRVAPNLRVPGSGAQSDYELKNFLKSMPTLGNTPEGNALVAKTMQGLYQNKITAAEIGAKALSGETTRPQAEKALRDLPDPMKDWRESQKSMKPDTARTDALKKKYGLQ